MKSLIAITIATALTVYGQAPAQKKAPEKKGVAVESADRKDKAPQAVLDAFKKQYPNATIKTVSSEKQGGKTIYEIESMDGLQRRDLMYEADGKVISTEELIPAAQVPKVVADALAAKYPKAPIVSAEKLTDKDGMRYEVVLKVNGKNKAVEIDSSGKIK